MGSVWLVLQGYSPSCWGKQEQETVCLSASVVRKEREASPAAQPTIFKLSLRSEPMPRCHRIQGGSCLRS